MRIRLKPLLVIVLAAVAFTVSASDSQRLADTLCVGKKDGHYALGTCSPDYLTCSNGTSFAHHCKFGLFFDKVSEQCSERKAISDCQAPFDCSDRDDGIYSEGCSRNFWYCFGGSAASASCQPGLYFNTETNTCEYFKVIKACHGKCNQKAPIGDTCSDHYYVCIDHVPTRRTCEKHEAYDDYHRKCRNLNDLPQCVLNHIHREMNSRADTDEYDSESTATNDAGLSAPDTLQDDRLHATYPTYTPPTTTAAYFEGSGEEEDVNLGEINRISRFDFDDSYQIVAAVMRNSGGNLHGEVNEPGEWTRVGDLPDLRQSLLSTHNAGYVESLVPTFCLDRPDGNFFVSCSQKFINCLNSVATVMSCPTGLVFSEDLDVCDFAHDVPSCATEAQPRVDEPIASAPISDQVFAERPSGPLRSGRQLDLLCQDGRSSPPLLALSSCSPYFIACKNGAAIIASCDDKFLFNEDTLQCETPYEAFCPEKLPSDAEQICETVGSVPFLDGPLFKGSCSEHSVRVFEECADAYYICHEQTFIRRDCPDGSSFDSLVGACVAHCGDAQLYKQRDGSSYNDLCRLNGPGKHGIGCTSAYVDCSSNGVSTVHECEHGLVFNKDIKGCALYCEGTPVGYIDKLDDPILYSLKASEHSDSTNNFKDSKPFEDFRGDLKDDDRSAQAFCVDREDGHYAIGCNSAYYSCFNGHGAVAYCREGLVFNSDLSACADSCGQQTHASSTTFDSTKTQLCLPGFTGILPTSQCTDVFVNCLNGVEYKQACPAGRFFNVRTRSCQLTCDYSDASEKKNDVDGLVRDDAAKQTTTRTTTRTRAPFRQPVLRRQQRPPTFITDGFSRHPVYIPRVPRPLRSDHFAGIPPPMPVRVPFTPNNIPGRVGFDAFDRGDFPEMPRVVQSPYPHFRSVKPLSPPVNPQPANPLPPVRPPPVKPRPYVISPPVTPRPVVAKPLPVISDSEEISDLLNDSVPTANNSAEIPVEDTSVEGSGVSAEEEIEPETATLWRKKREITTQCQYKRRWYNPNVAFIENYDFVPQIECAAGKTPLGCTGGYLECVNGIPQLFSCPDDFVYDKPTARCILNRNAKCTLGVTVLESKLPQNHDVPVAIPSHRHVAGNAFEEHSADPRCTFGTQGAVPLGFCLSEFLLCLPNGQSSRTYCLNTQLFDHATSKCVPAAECGQQARSEPPTSASSNSRLVGPASVQCLGREDGDVVPTGKCLSSFIRCVKGEPVRSFCPKLGDAFSARDKACIPKAQLSECRPAASMSLALSSTNASNLCADQPDGYYRHPESCQRIIQCFGRETFEHQPCQHDLAFDTARGLCDYRRNVPGCDNTVDATGRADSEATNVSDVTCSKDSHGAHVPNKSDCSSYFRCVWGRLEAMQCPEGTVFNPNLSVCDYADQVPHCGAS